jgi:hypothetical protein
MENRSNKAIYEEALILHCFSDPGCNSFTSGSEGTEGLKFKNQEIIFTKIGLSLTKVPEPGIFQV